MVQLRSPQGFSLSSHGTVHAVFPGTARDLLSKSGKCGQAGSLRVARGRGHGLYRLCPERVRSGIRHKAEENLKLLKA